MDSLDVGLNAGVRSGGCVLRLEAPSFDDH